MKCVDIDMLMFTARSRPCGPPPYVTARALPKAWRATATTETSLTPSEPYMPISLGAHIRFGHGESLTLYPPAQTPGVQTEYQPSFGPTSPLPLYIYVYFCCRIRSLRTPAQYSIAHESMT